MKRRNFIKAAVVASAGNSAPTLASKQLFSPGENRFSLDRNVVKIWSKNLVVPSKVLMVADTHLWMDDRRGEPFTQYSGRMAKAYNQTTHFQTGVPTNPNESFQKMIALGKELKIDLLALPGDLFSFPSEAAIDWVIGQLSTSDFPFQYTAGNHDWHYEGMPGSLISLRKQWTESRLKPLYQGESTLMSVKEINGIRFISIDNSVNEILPEQLSFYREQVKLGKPMVLFVHIPLYVPGRSMGFGCGHPKWGWDTDRNFTIERRERWPKSGHTPTTMNFHKEVFSSPNLLGIFAGHTHSQSLDVVNGIPQFVTPANATGGFLEIDFMKEV